MKIWSILIVFLLISIAISCSNNIVQTNPCDDFKIVQSRIKYSELNDLIDLEVEEDTMSVYSIFRISIDAPNYSNKTFILSGDPTIHKDSSTFRMKTTYSNIRVIAYLSGYKDSLCSKNYKKYDTIVRNLTIVPIEKIKLIGEYWGCNLNNPSDSFMIRIKPLPYYPNDPNTPTEIRIFNFNKGCNASGAGLDSIGNQNSSFLGLYVFNSTFSITKSYQRSIVVNGKWEIADKCANPEGYGFLNKNGDLEIHYSISKYRLLNPLPNDTDSLNARDTLVYIGKRVR